MKYVNADQGIMGRQARDKLTDFTGTVIAVVFYITGCHQVLLQPRIKPDGTMTESQWIDLQRLEVTSNTAVVLDNSNAGFGKAPPKNITIEKGMI